MLFTVQINVSYSPQDSDAMICSNNQSASITPSSAMSISPATSEVGSLKSNLLQRQQQHQISPSKLESAFKRGGGGGGCPGGGSGKMKSTYWGTAHQKASGKEGPDRSDMDLNWRKGAAATVGGGAAAGAGGAAGADGGVQAPTGGTPPRRLNSATPPSQDPDRADRDPNWRIHKEPERDRRKMRASAKPSSGNRRRDQGSQSCLCCCKDKKI